MSGIQPIHDDVDGRELIHEDGYIIDAETGEVLGTYDNPPTQSTEAFMPTDLEGANWVLVFGYEFLQNALSSPAVDKGMVSVGVDWARYRDYTAAVAVRGTKLQAEVIAVDAWNGTSWSEIISRTAAFTKDVGAAKLTSVVAGLGEPVTEFLQKSLPGVSLELVTFTNQRKGIMIGNLAWMLEKGRLRLSSDVALLRELEAYAATVSGTTTKYAADSRHGDRVCALALACDGLPAGGSVTISGKERK